MTRVECDCPLPGTNNSHYLCGEEKHKRDGSNGCPVECTCICHVPVWEVRIDVQEHHPMGHYSGLLRGSYEDAEKMALAKLSEVGVTVEIAEVKP